MSLIIVVLLAAGIVALLCFRGLRVRAFSRLDDWSGRFQAKLGPMTPVQLAKRTIRAADRASMGTLTGYVLPNVIKIGVSVRDAAPWGPLIDVLPDEVAAALVEHAASNETSLGGHRPTVELSVVSGVRSHRPRFTMTHERVGPVERSPERPVSSHRTPKMQAAAARPDLSGRPTDYSPADGATVLRGLEHEPTRRLCVLAIEDNGRLLMCLDCREGVYTGGRSSRCDLRIPHGTVSEFHFELRVARESVSVRDIGSTNGTKVGRRSATDPIMLYDDDVIALSREITMTVMRGAERRAAA